MLRFLTAAVAVLGVVMPDIALGSSECTLMRRIGGVSSTPAAAPGGLFWPRRIPGNSSPDKRSAIPPMGGNAGIGGMLISSSADAIAGMNSAMVLTVIYRRPTEEFLVF